jgi:predicted dehydrogenase
LDDFEVAAVSDVDAARMADAAQFLEAEQEADQERLFARSDIDAVVVATGVRWHVPIGLQAVAAGKHVFVEKPLADTAGAANALADAADAAGVVGMVGYQHRFNPAWVRLAELLPEIDPVQGTWTLQRGPLNPQFFIPDHFGGIVDTTTHTLDLALWTMGLPPEGVMAHVLRGTIQGDRTIEYVSLIVDFAGGTRSTTLVSSMMGVGLPNVCQFAGSRGTAWSDNGRTLHITRHAGVREPGARNPDGLTREVVETENPGDTTVLMLQHFAALIEGRADRAHPRGCTLRQGAATAAVQAAMVVSAEEGRRVRLADLA